MKYFITGGFGFLGSNIAAKLINRGHEVYLFDNLYRLGSIENLNWLKKIGGHSYTIGDVKDPSSINDAIKKFKPDVIFHLAGQVAMTTSIINPRLDLETNVIGSFNLLEAAKKYSPDAVIIYSSSNKVYGDLSQFTYSETKTRYICEEKPNGFDEFTELSFHSPYGVSKGAADQYMLDYHRIYGMRTIVFRHSSMFGGRQYTNEDQGWLGWFIKKALESRTLKNNPKIEISGNGKQVRDLLFAEDCVDLYVSAAAKNEKLIGRAFNIGGGLENSMSIIELFSFLEERLDTKLNIEKLPPRASDQKVFIADIQEISKALNWLPTTPKEDGLISMIEWESSML